jgi:D-alanyl-D-alanine carboxypeptidase
MKRRRVVTSAALLILCSSVWSELPGSAAGPAAVVSEAAIGGAPAQRLNTIAVGGDLVTVFNTGELLPNVGDAAIAAAADVGAVGVIGRGFGVGMTQLTRDGAAVHQATPGWYFPMSITALPIDGIVASMGAAVATPVSAGQVVMGQTSATLTQAQAGDTVNLVGFDGSIVGFVIGRIAPDAEVGGTEIVMSMTQADSLGATVPTRVLIYGNYGRAQLEAAMAARGLSTNPKIRVRRSWDPFDPDITMSLAQTKTRLGEFDYVVGANDSVSVDPTWKSTYIPPRETYPTGIFAACNNTIKADLAAALAEVVASGLAGAIDVGNANTAGGCYGPRFTRIFGTQLGTLSRHTWAQALDTNTVSNCQGCVPQMDCRVVRIFRKHNFAWGGNFLLPDGMHFEWVGEPRNTQQYPSRSCANAADGGIQALQAMTAGGPAAPADSRGTMFVEDGWALSGD